MDLAAVAVSAILAVLCAASAVAKLSHADTVVAGYEQAGVPEHRLNALAGLLLLGAAGLLLGLVWAPIGIGAAACLVAYFAGAVGAHVRAHDHEHLATPVAMLVLACASLVLQLAR